VDVVIVDVVAGVSVIVIIIVVIIVIISRRGVRDVLVATDNKYVVSVLP